MQTENAVQTRFDFVDFQKILAEAVRASNIRFEEDASARLESIEATATPKKYTGDLAQTTVGAGSAAAQVVGLMDWSIDWKMKTIESTTTDSAGHEESLDSTSSWTAKAKFLFIDGDTSQSSEVVAAISTRQGALQWNFFNAPETGRAGYSGKAYIDGITIASGVGQVVGLDVSLKGTGPLVPAVQTAPVSGVAQLAS